MPQAAPAILNAMTVDVEDYFQVTVFDGIVPRHHWDRLESRVCANTERLLAIFEEGGVHATFFILGWVGERFPGLVRQIASLGHEVALHSYEHKLLYDLTPAWFREDLTRGRGILESAAGVAVRGFRAPSYSMTSRSLWALDVLIEEGFRYDASIFPIYHDRYGIPSSPRHAYRLERSGGSLIEIPASTIRCGPVNLPVGGGAYFRLLPYAWTRRGIAYLNRVEHKPAIFYVHPWELDPDQPRFETTMVSRFRHYWNLHKTEGRLRHLLSEFSFGTVAEVLRATRVEAVQHAPAAMLLPYVW